MNSTPSQLNKQQKPLGIVDTLSEGLAVVGRHPWLLLLPLLLDLFLWWGPPLSLAPGLIDWLLSPFNLQDLEAAGELPPTLASDMTLLVGEMRALLAGINIWALLASPLLFLPSIMGAFPPVAPGLLLSNLLVVAMLTAAIALVGLWVSMVWLHWVAGAIPRNAADGQGSEGRQIGLALGAAGLSTLRFVALLLALIVAFFGLLLPASFAVALVTLLMPGIGSAMGSLLTLAMSWLGLWVALHLFFVPAALVYDGAGILAAGKRSVLLVRRHFWSALGFIGLTTLLDVGFGLIWFALGEGWAARSLSMVGSAALGTGIAAAMFIFYRERVPQADAALLRELE